MSTAEQVQSVLAIDEGTIATKAVLVDQVDGTFRFIAKGEAPNALTEPQGQALSSVQSALHEVEAITGRMLLSASGEPLLPEQPDGHGVDAMVAITSLFPPLRVVIAGMISDLSVESARRAVRGTYSVIDDIIAMNDGDQRWGESRGIEAKLEHLSQDPPDVILIVGGVDGGATCPVVDVSEMLIAVASVVEPGRRPTIIFAGNKQVREQAAEMLADHFEFRVVDNVRPRLDVEILSSVQDELERVYLERGASRLPELSSGDASAAPVMSTARAFELVVRFVARQYNLGRGVLGVDLGGANGQVFAALGSETYGLVRCGLGTGVGLESLLSEVPLRDVQRWLPFDMSEKEARNRILNKALFPLSVPQAREDLLLEQAVAREVLRLIVAELRPQWQGRGQGRDDGLLPPVDLILGSGGVLGHAPNPGQAAMVLLDALQPVGLCRLALDRLGIMSALGAMGSLQPLAAAEVLDQDGFLELGTVIAPVGVARIGDIALRLKVAYTDGSTINVEVPYGSLEVIPLPLGQTATIELRPTRHFDIGWKQRGRAGKLTVKGGAVGVLVDARGRPLTLPQDAASQRDRVQEWLWSVGG